MQSGLKLHEVGDSNAQFTYSRQGLFGIIFVENAFYKKLP